MTRSDQLGPEIVDPRLLERLRQRQAAPGDTSQGVLSPLDSVRPSFDETLRISPDFFTEAPSRLELDYADRLVRQGPAFADSPLEQFGYRMLGGLGMADQGLVAGAINDSYRLGIGDEVVITFRGQTNESYRTNVDREGQVILPDLPPIPAAGRSFGDFRAVLEQVTSATFLRTDAFVSIGKIRNFPVYVLGQVHRPGVHRLTGLASVLDAVSVASGVQKSGSLRNIQIIRGTRVVSVDLYELLLTGQFDDDLGVMEGDRIFVPPVGRTIGVAGDVQRPGIYELGGRAGSLSVGEALDLAGGTLRPGGYRYLKVSAEQEGGDQISEISDPWQTKVGSGDILLVAKSGYSWEGAFFLDGHVSVPGPRALRWDPTVSGVVNAPDVLQEDPYLLFAVLERSDAKTRARHFAPVDLGRIVAGQSDLAIEPMDRLIVLSMDDIRFLSSEPVQAVLRGDSAGELFDPAAEFELEDDDFARDERGAIARSDRGSLALRERSLRERSLRERNGTAMGERGHLANGDSTAGHAPLECKGLKALASVVSRSRSERFSSARVAINPERVDSVPADTNCPEIFNQYPSLLPFVLEYATAVHGDVRLPGIYPIVPGTPLGSLVPVAGGLSPEADTSKVELTRFSPDQQDGNQPLRQTINAQQSSLLQVAVNPGDIVRFNPKFSQRDIGSVFLFGEFKRPGVYPIRRGERLSEVIDRAGGMTQQAYALGAVFTRERVKTQESKAFERAALDLESGLAEALARGQLEQGEPGALVQAVSELTQTLRDTEPVGRVVVEADPTVLQVRPEFDTILEPGDRLFVPKRPNYVAVSGEVLNPGTMQFRAGKTVDEYIDAAGGATRVADDGRTFVIYPNGEAQSVSVSSWNFTPVKIPPGSTVVIPRDPAPFNLTEFSVNIADILSKLAISAASIAVIGAN